MTQALSRPRLTLATDGPSLALGRAHEAAGPARRVFAAAAAGRLSGPVVWIVAGPSPGRLHPEGLMGFCDPARLVTARARRPVDGLWAAEEALRAGCAPCVVLETPAPPALTPVRRLQLAAEAGAAAEAATAPPLCLILTPEGGSAAAVETRWWIDPLSGWASETAPGGGPARWRVALLRDKAGPPGVWEAVDLSDRPETVRPRFRRAAA
jgi:protein ImuA